MVSMFFRLLKPYIYMRLFFAALCCDLLNSKPVLQEHLHQCICLSNFFPTVVTSTFSPSPPWLPFFSTWQLQYILSNLHPVYSLPYFSTCPNTSEPPCYNFISKLFNLHCSSDLLISHPSRSFPQRSPWQSRSPNCTTPPTQLHPLHPVWASPCIGNSLHHTCHVTH